MNNLEIFILIWQTIYSELLEQLYWLVVLVFIGIIYYQRHGRGCHPGRIVMVVNDRLRRKTEIYGGRTRTPHTGTVYDVKRLETDSVYGDRVKIRSD